MRKASIAILVGAVIIAGAIIVVAKKAGSNNSPAQEGKNVEIVDGVQIVTISARGGYSPRVTEAQAGIPTIIRVDTKNTFDCSSALVIPDVGYRGNLPPTGSTEIKVPPQKAGAVVRGLCSMGMYNFQVAFN